MLQKIKDLVDVSRLIDEIQKKVSANDQTVKELTDSVTGLRGQLEEHSQVILDLKKDQDKQHLELASAVEEIKTLTGDFRSCLYDMTVFRKDAYSQLLKRFDEGLKKELTGQIEGLKTTYEKHIQLNEEVSRVSSRTEALSSEMDKFLSISRTIKEGDFELGKFANQMRRLENEKMALVKKIDSLERLVSRLRRR